MSKKQRNRNLYELSPLLNRDKTNTRSAFIQGYCEVYIVKNGTNEILTIGLDNKFFYVIGFADGRYICQAFKRISDARKFTRQYAKLKKNFI